MSEKEPGQMAWETYVETLGEGRWGPIKWNGNGPSERNRAAWAAVEAAIRADERERCEQALDAAGYLINLYRLIHARKPVRNLAEAEMAYAVAVSRLASAIRGAEHEQCEKPTRRTTDT